MSSSHHPHNSGAQSPLGHHHHHHLQHHHLHLQQQQQQQQQQTANNNNSSSNASTPNSNTSFLIKDILRYEGQKRKQRKARTAFSDHQLKELEASFESRKYLTVQDRVKLAHDLKLSDTQVKTWYQNRRTKHKRQTAVGLELLNDVNHFYAYQSALQQSGAQWLLSHCAAPSTQLNFAAAAAVLAAQAAHAQAVSPQQQQQVAAAQAAHSLAGHQSAASVIKPALSPQHSPQDHRLLDGSSDSSK